MRSSLWVMLAFAAAALAQAPVEDRSPRGDPLVEAQQRVEFARRAAAQAQARVREAERALQQAQATEAQARKQYEQAKAQADSAQRELEQARRQAAARRQDYRREAAEFERLRRGAGTPTH